MTNLGNCCKARKPQQDGQAKKDHCIKPNPNSVHSHGTKGAKRREETTVKERCDDKSDECKHQFKRVIFCSGSQGLRWSAVVKCEIATVYIPALQIYVDFHAESVQDLCVDYVDDQSDWNSIRLRLIFYYS